MPAQMIDEEDCPICEEFDQQWIFTYGDMVTLLLCFFILLFSMCKLDIAKFNELAKSLKPTPAGSPYLLDGKDSIIQTISQEIESSELAEETSVNVEDHGVVVSFQAKALFAPGSFQLTQQAKKELTKFAKLLYFLPNAILVEGHTDNSKAPNGMSNWELSAIRSSVVARYLVSEGVDEKKITTKGYGQYRPAFRNSNPDQRALNNRVEIVLVPEKE